MQRVMPTDGSVRVPSRSKNMFIVSEARILAENSEETGAEAPRRDRPCRAFYCASGGDAI